MIKSPSSKKVDLTKLQKKRLIEHFRVEYPFLLLKHIRSAIDLADSDMVLTNIYLEMKSRNVWEQLQQNYPHFYGVYKKRIGIIIKKDKSGTFTCLLL